VSRLVKAIRASDGLRLWVLESPRYRRFAARGSEPAPSPDVVWVNRSWKVAHPEPDTVRPGKFRP
jgi:hypothetical protein